MTGQEIKRAKEICEQFNGHGPMRGNTYLGAESAMLLPKAIAEIEKLREALEFREDKVKGQ
jgi:hypothetical protein